MYLKIFVIVIPNEGLAGPGPANPSLGITPTTLNFHWFSLLCCLHQSFFLVWQRQRSYGRHGGSPWMFWHSHTKGPTINDLGGRRNQEKKISKALLQEKKISRGLPGKKINFKRPRRGKKMFKKASAGKKNSCPIFSPPPQIINGRALTNYIYFRGTCSCDSVLVIPSQPLLPKPLVLWPWFLAP